MPVPSRGHATPDVAVTKKGWGVAPGTLAAGEHSTKRALAIARAVSMLVLIERRANESAGSSCWPPTRDS
jgi:hypothetical protein